MTGQNQIGNWQLTIPTSPGTVRRIESRRVDRPPIKTPIQAQRDEKGWIPRARRRRRRARGRGEELEVEVVVDVVERRRGRRPSGPPGDGGGERAEETAAEGIGSGIRRTWVGQPIVGRIASLDDLSFARFNSLAAVEARRRTNGGRFNPSDKAVPPPRLSVSLW
ncbi:hypothetical protein B296_00009901 [Ensete ventricosum]|uniref:Uncharacterized protein n=1 Tax=Ensete ventricosum TaxID=4639 RepID=A0A426YH44_ENSVE|nr:hypothetical protein B296_00009901 [Ensete ventricosum]